ncbi:uncharacterized protein LOC104907424 [Beta vulgaris subsp. vulgaris]|uniref:uncharacterized protein LOC104907424 n=1 Tax=Beta vulgaris subsp. vulgaris TaxID=3555 RepID=UPI0020372D2A|nr:uncharacterized protein LOC104907424 [Beta vulgaris subsp. vulgaris]
MEGKHKKINVLSLLVFLAFVQIMSGAKVVGCGIDDEYCDIAFNWCCDGYACTARLTGGVCVRDHQISGCRDLGGICGYAGLFHCCGRNVCTEFWGEGTCVEA